MSTLFPLPPARKAPWAPSTAPELPELPRNAGHARHPASPAYYSLEAFHELLSKQGIALHEVHSNAEALHFLHRRQGVFEGTWPLFSYTDTHECGCEFCSHADDTTVYWTCPYCHSKLCRDDTPGEDWEARCEPGLLEPGARGTPCGARFTAREVMPLQWQIFLVPDAERSTPTR